jgi:two-component system CheB/CheR fusion protein
VTVASTVREALEWTEANRHSVELIITDFTLGRNETGIQLVENIRKTMGHSLPAIILTGRTMAELHRDAARCRCQLLHKPVGGEQLLDCIDNLLHTPQGR